MLHIPAKTVLLSRNIGFQRFFGDVDHILAALLNTAIFTAVTGWSSHLPCDFGHDFVLHGGKGVKCGTAITRAFGDAQLSPVNLRIPGGGHDRSDCSSIEKRTLGINRAVYRRDDLGRAAHLYFPLKSGFMSGSVALETAMQFPIGYAPVIFDLFPMRCVDIVVDHRFSERFLQEV